MKENCDGCKRKSSRNTNCKRIHPIAGKEEYMKIIYGLNDKGKY